MKKYSKPQIDVVEMETAQVIATSSSMGIYEEKSTLQLQDRRRGNRGNYEEE